MPVVCDFKGVIPDDIFRPYVAISGASSTKTPSAVFLLDTGFSGGLSIDRKIASKIAVPANGVALKVKPLGAIVEPDEAIIDASIVETTAALDSVVRVDVDVKEPYPSDYNVLSIGFLKDAKLSAMLRPNEGTRYAIDLGEGGEALTKMGFDIYATDVLFVDQKPLELAPEGISHVAVMTWSEAQPFLPTILDGTEAGTKGQAVPVLWDTGASVNVIRESFAESLGVSRSYQRKGFDVVVLKEVSLKPITGDKLQFKNVPFLVGDGTPGSLTMGSTMFGQFESIGMCTKVGAREDLHFSFERAS